LINIYIDFVVHRHFLFYKVKKPLFETVPLNC
jgi:hypothetical protein